MSDNLLTLRNIETYYGPILAIKGISLDVQEGQIVTILGANGAGKTTILKTISGAMDPQKGRIEFMGNEIQKRNPDWVARKGIAHVPEGREVFPLLSIHENLLMGAYSRKNKNEIHEDLEIVYDYFPELKVRNKQKSGLLSGGQQQMLVLGRAMMARPGTDAAGRALPWPVASFCSGYFHHHQTVKHHTENDHVVGGTKCQHGAEK